MHDNAVQPQSVKISDEVDSLADTDTVRPSEDGSLSYHLADVHWPQHLFAS